MELVAAFLSYALSFLIVISVVITVHELGHYWVGRIFNAAAESFSVGMGNPIFEVKDKRGTRWRVNWLPIGGFVKFVGEIQAPTDKQEAVQGPVGKSYLDLGPFQRMAISLGGPAANFIFAIVVFAAMGMAMGVPKAAQVVAISVDAGTPAEAAGFKPGDQIIEAGGRKIVTADDISRATMLMAGEPVHYRVRRGADELELVATPRQESVTNEGLNVTEKIGRIGLHLENRGLKIYPMNPIEAVSYGVAQTGENIAATVTVLRRLVTGKDGLDKLSGPIGIVKIAGGGTNALMKQDGVTLASFLTQEALWLIQLATILSIGVGFFNLLPIPVLDGGAVVMCVAEALTGREVPEKLQRVALTIGVACLVSFALVISWQDIFRGAPPGSP
ncbi:MAG TPA: RIP metalloprotease [Hyphomonadaceae bacterium]|nr:RIP metalloprotease [Hyphomonadaceae bacterium]